MEADVMAWWWETLLGVAIALVAAWLVLVAALLAAFRLPVPS